MRRDDNVMRLAAAQPSPREPQRAGSDQWADHHAMAVAPAAMDLIFIEGFEGETVIGIDPGELHTPQPLRIDVVAGLPRSGACISDHIVDTIDYGAVRAALRDLMQTHGVQLLEAFAERIAQLLIGQFGAHWVRVKVVKPRKFGDVEAVGVAIERWRARPGHDSLLDWMGRGLIPS
ncbi:dihydroneopterin aldolase [Cupriavidus necator]